jgi:hypothetical protein
VKIVAADLNVKMKIRKNSGNNPPRAQEQIMAQIVEKIERSVGSASR